ncbi:PREDICTED: natural cytotoxicity triggering receptor 2 [Sturnus vulgaris]|uniref:natural cytotoxicity triggering receptor 2 n=1 Tax=Sturnus vulgaris TaxID=9172 RepID=UPI00071A7D86|nr:PREDICTED: natural cytotoxicity triggering receptor 2 [Sturnus vulgaris]
MPLPWGMAMELRALILLPLCFPGLQGQTSEAHRRREGDTLYIQCPYNLGIPDQALKYWCLQKNGECQELLRTYYEYEKKTWDGRIQMRANTTSKAVSITMADLKAEDSGTYFCAYYYTRYKRMKTISLNVFKELLLWELDTLRVQCPAWCQRGGTVCTVQRKTSSRSAEKSLQDRALIQYNDQGTPTVTVKQLQIWDSGVYWCALGTERTTEVVLSVFKRTQQLTAQESGSVSVQCHYKVADYGAATKAWCKMEGETCNVLVTSSSEPPEGNSTAREGVRLQDDSQQGIVTVTMGQLQPQDSGVYWCALQELSALSRMEEITLSVSRALSPGTKRRSEDNLLGESSCSGSTFFILSVVLLVLLLLALVTVTALGVRHYRLLLRTGNRGAEGTRDRPEGTAQPGSTGRRGSSHINLDVQSLPSPEDPLYCNVEPSQAHRNPQCVEYAVIAFKQSPGSSRE